MSEPLQIVRDLPIVAGVHFEHYFPLTDFIGEPLQARITTDGISLNELNQFGIDLHGWLISDPSWGKLRWLSTKASLMNQLLKRFQKQLKCELEAKASMSNEHFAYRKKLPLLSANDKTRAILIDGKLAEMPLRISYEDKVGDFSVRDIRVIDVKDSWFQAQSEAGVRRYRFDRMIGVSPKTSGFMASRRITLKIGEGDNGGTNMGFFIEDTHPLGN